MITLKLKTNQLHHYSHYYCVSHLFVIEGKSGVQWAII